MAADAKASLLDAAGKPPLAMGVLFRQIVAPMSSSARYKHLPDRALPCSARIVAIRNPS